LTSKGQKRETSEAVRKRSATTWENISRKHFPKPSLGIWDQHFQAMDATNPINKAKNKLWVGPRWKAEPFPRKRSPKITSMSGILAKMTTKRITFHL
jgi:hypothetical protein